MSRQTTPVGLVMTAIVVGRGGSGRLRARVEQALLGQARLERLEAQGRGRRSPAGWIDST